jgi:hypothetical protein
VEPLIRRAWRLILLWALVALGAALADARAQRVEASEATVKAAFLFKFAAYVEWPPATFASPDAPFVFGVVGADEGAAEIAKLAAGRTIEGHPVVVRRLKEGESPRGVHVLFLGRGASERQSVIARAAQQGGVLVVTETDRGLDGGSSINFITADDRVGFEVSLEAAEKNGLRISSRMLSVARRVVQRGG